MSKKIIAVNAGPRMGWNTDTTFLRQEYWCVMQKTEKYNLHPIKNYIRRRNYRYRRGGDFRHLSAGDTTV